MSKTFKILAKDIKNLAKGYGGCIATDMITVHGNRVGYMYRDEPNFKGDSGWCFMAGTETQEYMDNPDNLEMYDINTISNYDPEIISFLNSPIGSQYERNSRGVLVKVND